LCFWQSSFQWSLLRSFFLFSVVWDRFFFLFDGLRCSGPGLFLTWNGCFFFPNLEFAGRLTWFARSNLGAWGSYSMRLGTPHPSYKHSEICRGGCRCLITVSLRPLRCLAVDLTGRSCIPALGVSWIFHYLLCPDLSIFTLRLETSVPVPDRLPLSSVCRGLLFALPVLSGRSFDDFPIPSMDQLVPLSGAPGAGSLSTTVAPPTLCRLFCPPREDKPRFPFPDPPCLGF